MYCILASHIAHEFRQQFTSHVWPYDWTVGVKWGMDFVIKLMQLAIEKYIQQPQSQLCAPSRAPVFLNLKNMFNPVSHGKLLEIIQHRYPGLYPFTCLLYKLSGTVHFKLDDRMWRNLAMDEGFNQGCPLSSIFAAIVLNKILFPLDNSL